MDSTVGGCRDEESRDSVFDVDSLDDVLQQEVELEVLRRIARKYAIVRCLARRATDRYQAAADLIDDLQHWLRAEVDIT